MRRAVRGSILITTLWILTILALLAIGIGVRMSVDLKLTGFSLNRAKALYLAEAGFRKTVILLKEDDTKTLDTLNESWSCGYDRYEESNLLKEIPLGEGSFTVSYAAGADENEQELYLYGASAENGRININKAGDSLDLTFLPGVTTDIAECILDWKDEGSDAKLNGAEDGYYQDLEPPYECKDAPFSVPEELLLVKGVTREIYEGIKDLITVYGEGAEINLNMAPEDVLAAVIGDEYEGLARKIVIYRNGDDGVPGTDDDRYFQQMSLVSAQLGLTGIDLPRMEDLIEKNRFTVKSDVFRIRSSGSVADGKVNKTINAVVSRDQDDITVLYYSEY